MCEFCEKENKEIEQVARISAAIVVTQYLQEIEARNYEQAIKQAAKLLLLSGHLSLIKDAAIAPQPDEWVVKCVESLQEEVNIMMNIFGG
jgi:hypothetical protein